ncbi:MAG TPA: hypothetical protein VHE13_14820 [Opitutus sp.]|nr:hypothetical protein [Opitutus sp.]
MSFDNVVIALVGKAVLFGTGVYGVYALIVNRRRKEAQWKNWLRAWGAAVGGFAGLLIISPRLLPAWSHQRDIAETRRSDRLLSPEQLRELLRQKKQHVAFNYRFTDEVGYSIEIPAGFDYAANTEGGTRLIAADQHGQIIEVARVHDGSDFDETNAAIKRSVLHGHPDVRFTNEVRGHTFYGDTVCYRVEFKKGDRLVKEWYGLYRRMSQTFLAVVVANPAEPKTAEQIIRSFRVE